MQIRSTGPATPRRMQPSPPPPPASNPEPTYTLDMPMGTVTLQASRVTRIDAAGYRAVGDAKFSMLTSALTGGVGGLIFDAFNPQGVGGLAFFGGAGISMAMAVPVALAVGACAGAISKDPRPDAKLSAALGLTTGAVMGYLIGGG